VSALFGVRARRFVCTLLSHTCEWSHVLGWNSYLYHISYRIPGIVGARNAAKPKSLPSLGDAARASGRHGGPRRAERNQMVMVPANRFGSWIERAPPHRMTWGQLTKAQTGPIRPQTRASRGDARSPERGGGRAPRIRSRHGRRLCSHLVGRYGDF
jgi:hypothetical protein